jgi:hypothetical protein
MLTKRVSRTRQTGEWPGGINNMPGVGRQYLVVGGRQKLVMFLILLVVLPAGSLNGWIPWNDRIDQGGVT